MQVVIHTDAQDKQSMLRKIEQHSIPFFMEMLLDWRTYVVVYEGNRIVGMAGLLEHAVRCDNSIGIAFISTHKDHRNRGIAKILVDAVFKYAQDTGKNLANTEYEPDGEKYLRHIMHRTAEKYPKVKLFEYETA